MTHAGAVSLAVIYIMKSALTSKVCDAPSLWSALTQNLQPGRTPGENSTVCVWGPQSIVYEYQYCFIGSLEIYARSHWGTLNVSAGLWIGHYCTRIHPLLSLSIVVREFLRMCSHSMPYQKLRQLSVEMLRYLMAAIEFFPVAPPLEY